MEDKYEYKNPVPLKPLPPVAAPSKYRACLLQRNPAGFLQVLFILDFPVETLLY